MNPPLKIGLVGTGRIAGCHLNAYRRNPDIVKLQAVCDIRPEAAARFAKSAGIDAVYTDYYEMLEKADLDAVDICTSHDQHESQVIAAADAGKHVLVEKAMGRSLKECRNMIASAEKNRVTFMVGQDLRYLPHSLAIKRLIDGGELGTIRMTRCASIKDQPPGFPPGDWLLDGSKAGGGALISVTSHQIDLMRYYVGEIKSVNGVCRTVHPEYINDAEEYVCASLEFKNGAIGDIIAIYSPVHSPIFLQYMIFGDEGTVYSTPAEGEYQIQQFGPGMVSSNKKMSSLTEKPARGFSCFTPIGKCTDSLWSDDPFVNEILHFADCCRFGQQPLTSGKDNLNTLKVVFGIYESSRTEKKIELASL